MNNGDQCTERKIFEAEREARYRRSLTTVRMASHRASPDFNGPVTCPHCRKVTRLRIVNVETVQGYSSLHVPDSPLNLVTPIKDSKMVQACVSCGEEVVTEEFRKWKEKGDAEFELRVVAFLFGLGVLTFMIFFVLNRLY